MGLDMYLRGKRWIGFGDRAGGDSLSGKVTSLFPELANFQSPDQDRAPISEVVIEVGYWRKANAIHRWFVQHAQGGTDDCGYYLVDRDLLEILREACVQVLANPGSASEILPTTDGFFFGDTGYGHWYMADIQETLHTIDRALLLPKEWDFEYHSSW